MTKKHKNDTVVAEEKVYENVPVKEPDWRYGLSYDDVSTREENGLLNTPVDSPTKTEKQIIKEHCFTFFNLIFLVLAAILLAFGLFKDITFLVIVLANTAIGIFQEIRSKRTVDQLTLMSVRKVTVIRDGEASRIPSDMLVRDDIVEFCAGDQICADGIVCSGNVQVNESLITGEADAIDKEDGDSLLSGSFVISGRCRARLTSVGADSYASKLTLEAKNNVKSSPSEMINSLNKLIRVIGIILVPLGIILFAKNVLTLNMGTVFETWRESARMTIAALIGMIPEGLYLLTSVALAVSVIRLGQKKVLTQDMNCIETLARVDVLCVDKTGTITEDIMEANDPVLLDSGADADYVLDVLDAYYGAIDIDNDTAKAMEAKFRKDCNWKVSSKIPFTSATKWSSVTFRDAGCFIVGAPDCVLTDRYDEIADAVYELSSKGYRVLLLCEYTGELERNTTPESDLCIPLALIPIANRIRPEAPDTFRYFAEQGVSVCVISGDNPRTVSEIAHQAGIKNADRWIDAKTLKTDEDYDVAVKKYTVFGRVTPNQKRSLIQAFKRAGHTVAMTGDGVNDVLALKDSDCGIAMASGSDAACHVAKLVLLNSDFSALPSVVAEGRRVINNIERAASLFLVKNIFSFLFSIISLFFSNMPYPLVPIHLSMISALTIGVPSFFLALEPNKERVKGKFMHNVLTKALPGGITNLFMILILEAFYIAFGSNIINLDQLRTMSALIMSVIGIRILFQVCRPLDWMRATLIGVMSLGILVCCTVLNGFFAFAPLDFKAGLILFVLLQLSIYNMNTVLTIFYHSEKLIGKINDKLKSRKQPQ